MLAASPVQITASAIPERQRPKRLHDSPGGMRCLLKSPSNTASQRLACTSAREKVMSSGNCPTGKRFPVYRLAWQRFLERVLGQIHIGPELSGYSQVADRDVQINLNDSPDFIETQPCFADGKIKRADARARRRRPADTP
jgi:hypothetical protein